MSFWSDREQLQSFIDYLLRRVGRFIVKMLTFYIFIFYFFPFLIFIPTSIYILNNQKERSIEVDMKNGKLIFHPEKNEAQKSLSDSASSLNNIGYSNEKTEPAKGQNALIEASKAEKPWWRYW